MRKYSIDLINRYINGLDIEEYTIDELEDDPEFMLEVIKKTGDKNIYNLCSSSVKLDYQLVKYLVLNFSNDLDFIVDAANNYLDNTRDEINPIELSVIMLDVLPKDLGNPNYLKYKINIEKIYIRERVDSEIFKDEENNREINRLVGLGFWYLYDEYNSSEIIIEYLAKRAIDDIIIGNNLNLEDLIHTRFSSPSELEKTGVNNYLFSIINCYDSTLVSYLSTHLYLLDDLKKEVDLIIKKWDFYAIKMESKIYHEMIKRFHEYYESTGSVMGGLNLIFYIGRELGIVDKLKIYEGLDDEVYEFIMNELNSKFPGSDLDYITYNINNYVDEKIVYLNAKMMMERLLSGNFKEMEYYLVDDEQTSDGSPRVVYVDFEKKNTNEDKTDESKVLFGDFGRK